MMLMMLKMTFFRLLTLCFTCVVHEQLHLREIVRVNNFLSCWSAAVGGMTFLQQERERATSFSNECQQPMDSNKKVMAVVVILFGDSTENGRKKKDNATQKDEGGRVQITERGNE
jgi:hypothetical protein